MNIQVSRAEIFYYCNALKPKIQIVTLIKLTFERSYRESGTIGVPISYTFYREL